MYVCLCKGITSGRVRKLGEAGVDTPRALIQALRLDDDESCGFCALHIGRMVAIARGGDPLEYGRFRLDPAMRIDFENPDDTP
jgi:bacterioferritin-associated ferredoxin